MGDKSVDNYRIAEAPQSMLGAKQKAWFLDQLRNARATWKVWGNSLGTLDTRIDPQNLPPEVGAWKGKGYGLMTVYDWGSVWHERAEIYDAVRDAGMTGLIIVAGDRHSFWAGYAAKALPPAAFEPVGVSFVGGSMSSVGSAEANEYARRRKTIPRAACTSPRTRTESRSPPRTRRCRRALGAGIRQQQGPAEGAGGAQPELAPHLEFRGQRRPRLRHRALRRRKG